MKYFAYGSNLNEDDLIQWCRKNGFDMPKLLNPKPFRLENYKIGFTRYSKSRKGGVADLISNQGDFCWGVVFDVTQSDIDILDEKENVKSEAYRQITLPNGTVTYEVVEKKDFIKPSSEYVDLIIEGAKRYGLPHTWIDKLESFKK